MERIGKGADRSQDGAATLEPGATSTCCGKDLETGHAGAASPSRPRLTGTSPATVTIEFLEVDMPSSAAGCGACNSVRARLEEAVEAVRSLFAEAGVEVVVAAGRVRTEAEARTLGLRASPTIRVRGIEIAPEHRGIGEDRVWTWRGRAFDALPPAMLLDALLRAYAVDPAAIPDRESVRASTESYELPPYLRQFLTLGAAAGAGTPGQH